MYPKYRRMGCSLSPVHSFLRGLEGFPASAAALWPKILQHFSFKIVSLDCNKSWRESARIPTDSISMGFGLVVMILIEKKNFQQSQYVNSTSLLLGQGLCQWTVYWSRIIGYAPDQCHNPSGDFLESEWGDFCWVRMGITSVIASV